MERGDIHNIAEGAAGRRQGCLQLGKGQPNLCGEVGLRRAVGAASDLTGDE